MKIKFIKEYRALQSDVYDIYEVGTIENMPETAAQWLIDNCFAEKVEDAKGGWKPETGGTYYYVRDTMTMFMCGEVGRESWDDDDEDNEYRYSIGNVFKTEKSARRFIDYLKAVETVRHDEGFMEKESDNAVYPILKSSVFGAASTCDAFRQHAGEFYFDSYEHSKASLNKHPNEWLTILDYDWGKE